MLGVAEADWRGLLTRDAEGVRVVRAMGSGSGELDSFLTGGDTAAGATTGATVGGEGGAGS